MNLRKFASKMVTGVAVAGMTVSAFAPALALTAPGGADTIYESIQDDATRVSFVDSETELADLFMDLDPHADQDGFDMGTMYIYGNGSHDDDGTDSFDNIEIDLGADLVAAEASDALEVGIILKDVSNSGDPVYDAYYYNADDDAGFSYTFTKSVPSLSTSKLRSMMEDIKNDGSADANIAFAGSTVTLDGHLEEKISSTGTDQQIGDPDLMTDYVDEVWVYTNDGTDEKVFMYDVELSEAAQDKETVAPSNLKVAARGPVLRVQVDPELGSDAGVVGYLYEIGGDHDTDGDFTEDDDSNKWFSHYPLTYYYALVDDNFTVSAYTINGEGEESEVTDEDVDGQSDWDAELFNIEDELSDLDSEDANQKFYDYIQYLYKLAIIDGYSDGTYKEDEFVSRGALAKFIVNAFQIPFNLSGELFPDVDADHTFFVYIQSLKNAGVVGGYRDGSFGPDDLVNRGQLTKFIYNAATYFDEDSINAGSSGCFPDTGDHTFEDYICALSQFNDDNILPIIGGYSNGNYGPDDNLTRGQMSKVILNSAASIPVDSDVEDDSFISTNYGLTDTYGGKTKFVRPFVPPTTVEDFSSPDKGETTVDLTWEDLTTDDESVDAYMIEYKEDDEADDQYEPVDIDMGDTGATLALDIQTVPTGDVSFVIGDCTVTFDVSEIPAGTPISCAGPGFAATVNANGTQAQVAAELAQLTGITDGTDTIAVDYTAGDTFVTFSHVYTAGVVTGYGTMSDLGIFDETNGGVNGLDTSGTWSFTHTAEVPNNPEGVLFAPANSYTVTGLSDDTSYIFRITPFKFIPFEYSETAYASADATTTGGLRNVDEYDNHENMVFGEGAIKKVKTDTTP